MEDAASLKANEIKMGIHNKSTNYAKQLQQQQRQKGLLCISQILRYFRAARPYLCAKTISETLKSA